MTSQHILIIYMHNSKISCQKSLKYNICELNVMKKFVKKRNHSTLNIIISRKWARISFILNSFCDCCVNYWINFRNRKINCSTIEIKVKHFRANEIICLKQLMIRDDRTRRSCMQISSCAFEKMIIIINEIEKIIVIIIIKSLKH